ncbi:MAG: hypothetical protein ACK5KR_00335 [Breznakia sp.]
MKKVSNSAKEMNKVWIKKQQELGKTWKGYYIGSTIFAVIAFALLCYALFS